MKMNTLVKCTLAGIFTLGLFVYIATVVAEPPSCSDLSDEMISAVYGKTKITESKKAQLKELFISQKCTQADMMGAIFRLSDAVKNLK